jgi:hypothetical protein
MTLEKAKETPHAGGAGGCESEPNTTRPAPEKSAFAGTQAEARRIEWLRTRGQTAQRLARAIKKNDMDALVEINEFLLACKINDVLQEFDSKALSNLLDEKAEMVFKLASVVATQVSDRQTVQKLKLDSQKYRDQVKEKALEIKKAAQEAKCGTLSADVLARIEEAANLL